MVSQSCRVAFSTRRADTYHCCSAGDRASGLFARSSTPAPAGPAEKALADLIKLIERFDRADMPYEAKRRPGTAFNRIYDYDDYAHLARLAEWETLGLEEESW